MRLLHCLQGDPFEMFNMFFGGGGQAGAGGSRQFHFSTGGMSHAERCVNFNCRALCKVQRSLANNSVV